MPTLNPVFVPHLGREFKFQNREAMRSPFVGRSARLPSRTGWQPPVTPLPVDSSGDAKVLCPILGNDTYGDCGAAMIAHRKQIIKFRQGKGQQYPIDVNALVKQYLHESGGDNGLGEPQVIDMLKHGIAGVNDDPYTDALDIDITDVPLVRFCLDQFYTVQMGWSVPNAFINGFSGGSVWSGRGRPNPMHGHYTVLSDVGGKDTPIPDVNTPTGGGRAELDAGLAMIRHGCCPVVFATTGGSLEGYLRNWTWGNWCWMAPEYVASVNPDGFVVFTEGMFDATTGLDSKGRHITAQAALWKACGGNAISDVVIAKFPAPKPAVAQIDWSDWD